MSVYCNMPEDKLLEKIPPELDRDTLLVAALLFLLIRDGGDMKLILALGYILL